MPAALISRDAIVARLFDVFRERGYDGAALSDVARATGLGKGSLYHHFPGGKDEMVAVVLDRIDAWLRDQIYAPLRGAGSPGERLAEMLRRLDAFYVGGREACVLGNLVVGGSRARFQERLRRTFTEWTDALRDLARDAGLSAEDARDNAEDAIVRIEGALVVAAANDDPAPFGRALAKIERDLFRVHEERHADVIGTRPRSKHAR